MFNSKLKFPLGVLFLAVLLNACGGDSSTGRPDPDEDDSGNNDE